MAKKATNKTQSVAKNAKSNKTFGEKAMKKENKDLRTQVLGLLANMARKEVATTRKGTKYDILVADENETEFWNLWKEHKDEIKSFGVVVFRRDDEFLIRDFTKLEYDCSKKASKKRSCENLEKAREVHAANVKKSAKSKTTEKETAAIKLIQELAKQAGIDIDINSLLK